jgi:hypothetical protein
VFDLSQAAWSYDAVVPEILRTTQLPLEAPAQKRSELSAPKGCFSASRHDAAWWEDAMAGQDFSAEDRLNVARFNAALWAGLKGEGSVVANRPPADLRAGRQQMLSIWRNAHSCD